MHKLDDLNIREDDVLLTRLYQQYAPALLTHLLIHLPSRMDAEDVLVDVFVTALEQQTLLSTLPCEEQRLWLWRVTRNRQIDYYRRATRRQMVTLENVVETLWEEDEHAPEDTVLWHEEYHQLQLHFKRLSQLQQEVLRLRFVNGLRSNNPALLIHQSEQEPLFASKSVLALHTISRQAEKSPPAIA